MQKIDWSSLWTKEDWWACWIGLFLLILATASILVSPIAQILKIPAIGAWDLNPLAAFADKAGAIQMTPFVNTIILLIVIGILSLVTMAFMKKPVWGFIPGFLVIFALAWLAMLVSTQTTIKLWGFEYVIWALVFGLIISNTVGVPNWMKPAILTEYFVKVGLVCLGATILFPVILRAGAVGLVQAILVVTAVWFFTYWISRKLNMSQTFSSTMATGVSICGVSASIAAGGAVQGDPKETSYVIAWLLVGAVIMIIVMPPLARLIGLSPAMAGAWIGGTIDNTGAVAAAGGALGSKASLDAANIVKLVQNVLIGLAAFILAIWSAFTLKKGAKVEKPSVWEIWFRFPKFILGFIIASLIASYVLPGLIGDKAVPSVTGILNGYRNWYFALCFVCIGLETNIKELLSVGGGKPAAAYWIGQIMNVIWTLIVVYLLWSGMFFEPPIK